MRSPSYVSGLFLLLWTVVSSAQQLPLVLQGRFFPGADRSGVTALPQTFSWGASSVYASFSGASSVTIVLSASQPTNVTYGMTWLRCFVDGEPVTDAFTSYKQLNATVRLQTSTSAHTLRIAKLSDPSKGEVTLQSILLDSGSFTEVNRTGSLSSGRRMLILGDSYAIGYGNAGAVIPDTCKPGVKQLSSADLGVCQAVGLPLGTECADYIQFLNGNALEAFGPVAADALDADYQVLATSGSGMVGYSYAEYAHPDYDQEQLEQVLPSNALLFNRTLFTGGSFPNFSSWQPQVVVVASGTNDWHVLPPIYTLDEWVDEAIEFLDQIRRAYGNPAIIIQTWPAEQQFANALDGENGVNETIQYLQGMPTLYSEAVRRKLPNIHYLQLTLEGYDNYFEWCDGHPSAASDRAVAKQLSEFIDSVVPGWNVTKEVSLTVDQEAIRPNLQKYAGIAPVAANNVASKVAKSLVPSD